jgi:hypothetical protein
MLIINACSLTEQKYEIVRQKIIYKFTHPPIEKTFSTHPKQKAVSGGVPSL